MSKTSKLVEIQKMAVENLARNYVVSGAKVVCSSGSQKVSMLFPKRNCDTGYGAVGLNTDTVASVNFSGSFGNCKCSRDNCCPAFVSKWVEVEKKQYINGGNPLLYKSMLVCTRGGVLHFENNGQQSEGQSVSVFELPAEHRAEIEEIINSKATWSEKADLITCVYERYLYYQFQYPFDDYGRMRSQFGVGDRRTLSSQSSLNTALQLSGIDIREVIQSMGDDIVRVLPPKFSNYTQLYYFAQLVNTGKPADLKTRSLGKSLGDAPTASILKFSIWSRGWEPNMRSDFLGNYYYGYVGAAYFREFDFDDLYLPETMELPIWGDVEVGNSFRKGIDELRNLNPDKTDAEIMLLFSAGAAQFLSDKDMKKYIENALFGNWGDNAEDSAYAGGGINDYYRRKGIDKDEIIEKERN